MEKPLTARKRQELEMRSRIQNVALDLFDRDGFENVAVEQIAQAAGYDNASKFSACFKKRYGATPSQYRAHAKQASKRSSETKTE